MRKARGEIWVSIKERKRSSIFFLRAASLHSDLSSDPAKPCFRQVERHPPYRASPYVLVREGKVVCHSERHKPSWRGSESTTAQVPIPVPISFFLTHFTSVLYVIKKSAQEDGICKMTSEGMHLRPGLFSWLLALKARYPLYLLLCIFHLQACFAPWYFRFLFRQCRKKYPATCSPLHTFSSHITQTAFPVFPTERW